MTEKLQTYHATCDLGSNSFHLLIVRQDEIGGEIHVIDRIKEMVRLGGGIDANGELETKTRDMAIACLERFGQRLRDIPNHQIRAVGTQGLRRLRYPGRFLKAAEQALGIPIEIIAGREEARLIFLGVTGFMSQPQPIPRLVIDIGGGSTELICGSEGQADILESLPFGCVSITRQFFPNGRINAKKWQLASDHFRSEFRRYKNPYKNHGWQESVGCSGTIRAIHEVCIQKNWTRKGITRKALNELKMALLASKKIDDIQLAGLSERRKPVFIGGVILLEALFQDLDLRNMQISRWALREGAILDLLGRDTLSDPRQDTIDRFSTRYSVDTTQAARVSDVASILFEQIAETGKLKKADLSLLRWACQVHEIGLAVSHQNYQQHSAYLIEHSDMPGFSLQNQQRLASLVGMQREAIENSQPGWEDGAAKKLILLLSIFRLSLILCRSRSDSAIPELKIELEKITDQKGLNYHLQLSLTDSWQLSHALTVTDLKTEVKQLNKLGISFTWRTDNRLDFFHPDTVVAN